MEPPRWILYRPRHWHWGLILPHGSFIIITGADVPTRGMVPDPDNTGRAKWTRAFPADAAGAMMIGVIASAIRETLRFHPDSPERRNVHHLLSCSTCGTVEDAGRRYRTFRRVAPLQPRHTLKTWRCEQEGLRGSGARLPQLRCRSCHPPAVDVNIGAGGFSSVWSAA